MKQSIVPQLSRMTALKSLNLIVINSKLVILTLKVLKNFELLKTMEKKDILLKYVHKIYLKSTLEKSFQKQLYFT